jgi:hypothetical protein
MRILVTLIILLFSLETYAQCGLFTVGGVLSKDNHGIFLMHKPQAHSATRYELPNAKQMDKFFGASVLLNLELNSMCVGTCSARFIKFNKVIAPHEKEDLNRLFLVKKKDCTNVSQH